MGRAAREDRRRALSADAYARAALDRECVELARTNAGRNDQMNRAAYALGQFVGADRLDRWEVERRLFDAAQANGYVAKDGAEQARATIRSGIEKGRLEPRFNGAPPQSQGQTAKQLVLPKARTMVTQGEAGGSDPQTETIISRIIAELLPIRETNGEGYLREYRRIDTAAIADVLDRTDAIGWHGSVYFNQPDHPLHGQRLGCIVGIMTDAVTAQPTGAISRTYLDSDGRKVAKAKTLGSPAGIVRLSRDEDVLEGLHLAEGLETALAAMSIGLRPIWSTGSTALMATFPVLSGIECLTLIADHDESGAGEKAARSAESRWRQARREVRILRTDQIGDLNDAIVGATRD
jgi:hypothetical protein